MASTVSYRVEDSQWKIGIAVLPEACKVCAVSGLRKAVERGLEISQELVHVDTGLLKSTGRILESAGSATTTGFEVVYGGEEFGVDYAGYHEFEYPFLTPGMEQGLAEFGQGADLLIGPFG